MTYSFNNKNIITSYIKELLKDFNLPTCPVYVEKISENQEVGVSDIPGRIYIKGNYFVRLDENLNPVNVHEYTRGTEYLNLTKNLTFKSNYYDQYTHEYLGDYLRFLRDYDGVNLMPLYNCYSGSVTSTLQKYLSELDMQSLGLDYKGKFNYYVFPVKFNQKYTIKINSPVISEVFLIIGNRFKENENLVKASFRRFNSAFKNNLPLYYTGADKFEYTKSTGEKINLKTEYWSQESNLKMVIKLPSWVKTSITVLEGDYRINASGSVGESFIPKIHIADAIPAKFICNQELLLNGTKLSLLENQGNISYPFADRLVEYLFNLAITHKNIIERNVGRIQNKAYKNRIFKGYYDIFDDNLLQRLYTISKTTYNNIELADGKKIQNQKKISIPQLANIKAFKGVIEITSEDENKVLITTEDKILLGDFDGDGKITVADALSVLRIAAKLVEEDPKLLALCDMDSDDKITVNDALIILRTAARLSGGKFNIKQIQTEVDIENYSGPYNYGDYTVWIKTPEVLKYSSLIDHEPDLLFFVDKDLERLVNSL